MMNPTNNLPKPANARLSADERRAKLQAAYVVMMRAYLRRQLQQRAHPTSTSEVKNA